MALHRRPLAPTSRAQTIFQNAVIKNLEDECRSYALTNKKPGVAVNYGISGVRRVLFHNENDRKFSTSTPKKAVKVLCDHE